LGIPSKRANHFVILRIINSSFVTIICLATLGCLHKSADDFIDWARDYKNGLHVHSIKSQYEFDIQFMPFPYQEILSSKRLDSIDRQSNIYKLNLTIKTLDGEDFIQPAYITNHQGAQRDYYFTYQFENDIFLEFGDRKVACGLLHMERNTRSNGERFFHLIFEPDFTITNDFVLSIESELISSIPIRFKIRNSNIPTVEL